MAITFNTKININNDKVYQSTGQTVNLSGNTIIASTGILKYAVHPTFTGNTQIIDKQYVDSKIVTVTGQTIYNLSSPATATVGGITAGTVLTGKSTNELLKEILVPYLLPAFSSFSTNVSTPIEVGTIISGSKSFTFGFTNTSNVAANTLCIVDVTTSSILATNCPVTSPESATITTRGFSFCGDNQIWCGSAKNSCNTQFGSSTYTVTGLLPYYYGVCTCPGAAGANRPTATCAMVIGGTKVLASSSSSISINFNSGSNDYLWFAVPATTTTKVCWCVNALNNGTIGGGVSPACNLFPAPDTISATTACWCGCSYKVYISNKQTASISAMALS